MEQLEDGKVRLPVTMQPDQAEWLKTMAERYDLSDPDKALRIVLDFAIESTETDIFEEIRCRHCG